YIRARCHRWLDAEIDLNDAAGIGRGQSLYGIANPAGGWFRKIEIAIHAIGSAFAAERGEPFIDLFADRAELGVGGISQRQHTELDAIEARRALTHQFIVGTYSAPRRLAFAPGRGNHNQALRGG